ERRLQSIKASAEVAARLKACREFKLRNDGMEGAIHVMRRTEVAQPRVRLALECGHQAFGEARLADAGLSGEKHDPAFAELGLPPTPKQQIELFLPANQFRQLHGAPGIESADASCLAAHLPRLHRLGQPLHLGGTECAAVE